MYSCKSFFLYPLIPGVSTAHLTTDLSYSCLSLIRFPLCATTVSFQTPVFFLCTFPQLPLTPGSTAVCLLRLLKYCKYCRVAPVVVAVEESILWINHPDRKGLAGVRKGLGHWTFSRAVFTPVPTSKSIHPSIQSTVHCIGPTVMSGPYQSFLTSWLRRNSSNTEAERWWRQGLRFHGWVVRICWMNICVISYTNKKGKKSCNTTQLVDTWI